MFLNVAIYCLQLKKKGLNRLHECSVDIVKPKRQVITKYASSHVNVKAINISSAGVDTDMHRILTASATPISIHGA